VSAPSGGPAPAHRDRTLAAFATAAGAGLALLAVSRVWTRATVARPAPLPPAHVTHTGSALAPWLPAVALVALAGAGAVLATKGAVRRVVGALLVFGGAGLVAGAVSRLGAVGGSAGWPLVTAAGGLLVAVGGAVTVVRGRRWPGMSARYDRPARVGSAATDAQVWDALDRGDDPTGD